MNVRPIALDVLSRWEEGAQYINLALGYKLGGLEEADRRFLTALVYGTVEKCITLDYYIGVLSGRGALDATTRNILRLGLYELLYLNTPRHAAVSLTVDLARNAGEKSFVNGCLRSALRSPELLVPPPRERNLARHLSVKYSVPRDTVRLFLEIFGEEEIEIFLTSVNSRTGMTLRVNTLRTTREDYLARLAEAGIDATPTPHAPASVYLPESYPPKALPGWEEGLFFVQDEASAVAVCALGAEAHHRVLDLCACPGGKSFGAAMDMQNEGTLRAYDLHPAKLSLVEEGARRLGLSVIETAAQDAADPDPRLIGWADRIICDVPCSGLGVLSKKADLRYKDLGAASNLPALQYEILSAAALCLAEGGRLIYSTCTVCPQENEAVTDRFLAAHPDFTYVPFEVGGLSAPLGHLTLYPHIHRTDGFYIARLERRRA